MYTNQMRMTGLSGIDTESMVKQLMKAESMKLVGIRKSRELNVWRQEQYRDVAKTLSTFQNSFLNIGSNLVNSFRSAANYKSLATQVKLSGTETISTAISVSGTENAKPGSYKLKVDQLASKDVWTSANSIGGSIKSSGVFDYASIKSGDKFNVVLDDSKPLEISFNDTDIAEIHDNASFELVLNRKLKALGTESVNGDIVNKVSASIDGSGHLVISAGPGHTASVSGGSRTVNTFEAANALLTGTDRTVGFSVSVGSGGGLASFISVDIAAEDDEAAIVAAINNELKEQGVSGVSAKLKDGKISFVNSNAGEQVNISGGGLINLGFISSDVTLDNADVYFELGFRSGSSTKLDTSRTSLETAFGATGTIKFKINNEEFTFDSTDSIDRLMSKINGSDAGVKMSYDTLKGTFTLESTEAGGKNAITFEDTNEFLKNAFDFANKESAKDAIITINGVSTTRTSNDFTIEGLKIKLTAESAGKEFSIDIASDNTKSMDFIKKFVEEYNKLVDTLYNAYNTARPKSDKYSYYEPLTDEEKEALSDKALEKYEAKAKEGLLYRDPIISGIASSMRSMLYEQVDLGNGNKISLHEIGITTTKSYNDGGKIEIDEAKLTKALEERGDDIVKLFTKSSDITYGNKTSRSERMKTEGIAERLNDIIKDAIDSNGSIYNKAGIEKTSSMTQNELYKLISAQDQKISDMLTMLARKEDNYYMMFSKLESAMTQANNQMASLQGMLGL